MKILVVFAVSIVLVSILFCPMVMAGPPSMPSELQMVQPDPSLPKELSAFWGKWEWTPGQAQFFLIVEKIDKEKASLYIWRGGSTTAWPEGAIMGWQRVEANVYKESGKYKLWHRAPSGKLEYYLKGEYLVWSFPAGFANCRRVP